MKILVSNDDGIFAQGLWALTYELKQIGQVVVVAPDREQAATGTAVSLHQPIRVHQVAPVVPGVESYAVRGTPGDCVIVALGKLITDRVNLVICGINHGANLGDDVPISGTVGAALQAYLHGLPAIAISVPRSNSPPLDTAAKLAVLLAKGIGLGVLPANVFLNVNLPDLPPAKIGGISITHLANRNYTDVVEERDDGGYPYYWFVRQKRNQATDKQTDTWAVEHGNISITLLHANLDKSPPPLPDNLCSDLFQQLRAS
jgi:5'-nucleotidase